MFDKPTLTENMDLSLKTKLDDLLDGKQTSEIRYELLLEKNRKRSTSSGSNSSNSRLSFKKLSGPNSSTLPRKKTKLDLESNADYAKYFVWYDSIESIDERTKYLANEMHIKDVLQRLMVSSPLGLELLANNFLARVHNVIEPMPSYEQYP
jgi:hypothetical protein